MEKIVQITTHPRFAKPRLRLPDEYPPGREVLCSSFVLRRRRALREERERWLDEHLLSLVGKRYDREGD
jgi:hypothetical protein